MSVAHGLALDKVSRVTLNEIIPGKSSESGRWVNVTNFNLHEPTRRELGVKADRLKDTEQAVQDIANANVQELVD